MPELKTHAELLGSLGEVAAFPDPITELARRGFRFTGEVQSALAGIARPAPLAPALARRLTAAAKRAGKVHIREGLHPISARNIAADDYDLIVAARLTVLDAVLGGMFDSFTIPHDLPIDSLLDPSTAGTLATALSGVFPGIPQGSRAGDFHVLRPPVVTEVAGTDQAFVHVPFSLDFVSDVTSGGVQRRVVVATLAGTMRLVMQVTADVTLTALESESTVALALAFAESPAQPPQLEIAADSPLQPRPGVDLAGLALLLQLVLRRFLRLEFTRSPFFPIPEVNGARLVLVGLDVRTNGSPQGGLAVAGLRFAGSGNTPADPSRLLRFFPEPGRNVAIRAHERFLQVGLEAARRRGDLDRLAQEFREGVRIKAVDVRFGKDEIKILLDGVAVDACFKIDVDFSVVQTFRFELQGGQVVIRSEMEGEIDRSDKAACIALGILILIVALGVLTIPFIGSPIFAIFFATLLGGLIIDGIEIPNLSSSSVSVVRLDKPIPGTELLPDLSSLFSRAEDGVLTASATLGFKPDTINTYLYLRVKQVLGGFDTGAPLAGARVEVCELDVPVPAEDDVTPPESKEDVRVLGNKFIRTSSVEFLPPTVNPVLDQATTGFDGRVMFSLTPGQLQGTAGSVVTSVTLEEIHTGRIVSSNRQQKALREKLPDIFFRIHKFGDVADTSKRRDGVIVNLSVKRVGRPSEPMVIPVSLRPGILES